jgi:hypothetical protein
MIDLQPKFHEDKIKTEDFRNAPPFWGARGKK